MTTHLTTCWLDRAREHEFLGLLECYLETLVRLELLSRAPVVRRVPATEEGTRTYSYQLAWRSPEAIQRAEVHPGVKTFKRHLDLLCIRRRVCAVSPSPAPRPRARRETSPASQPGGERVT